MNSLCRFSLAVALSTMLFCLLMLSRGFAANGRQDVLVFAGQDKHGKVLVAMELLHNGGKWSWLRPARSLYLYSEKEGWVRMKRPRPTEGSPTVGGPTDLRLEGKLPGKLTLRSPENELLMQLETNHLAAQKQGYLLAGGNGRVEWKGRKLSGIACVHSFPTAQGGFASQSMQVAPGEWREGIYLQIANGGILQFMRQSAPRHADPWGQLAGMYATDSLTSMVDQLELRATAWKKIGLYKLPVAWQGSFYVEGKKMLFRITSERHRNVRNLFIKGTRLAVARGFLQFDGKSLPLYGMSIVSHFAEGYKPIHAFEEANRKKPERPGMSWETVRK